jgi:toxin ParE1/3/4
MAYRLALEAETDLDDIWLYTAQESGDAGIADRLIDSITNRLFLLATHPYVGRRRDADLYRSGLRSFPVGRYVIFYRVTDDEDVFILRVLAGARDIDALL